MSTVAVTAIVGTALVGRGGTLAAVALLVLGGLLLVGVSAWRPAIGCGVLALAVPLTAGLGRDTVLPLLRTSEAVVGLVALGLLLHLLPRRAGGVFTGLDLAIAGLVVAPSVLIPWVVVFVGHEPAGVNTWRVVLAPLQYGLVYWVFSRSRLKGNELHAVANLAMGASLVVAVVGLAQLADLPGVRSFIDSTFPLGGGNQVMCQFGVCRPTSLLEHWSAFGAFALLNYILALALAACRHPAFSGRWLALVMAFNAVAVIASQTQATVIGLLVATLVIVVYARRVPRGLLATLAAIVVGTAIFWSQVSARVEQQFFTGGGTSQPASLETRYQYWGDYFFPVLAQHLWTGTGTVIPAEIPQSLTTYVDNEYLRMAFRAGIGGVVALLLMLMVIGLTGWRMRAGPDPWARSIGGASVAYAIVLALMGTTAEYLTFAGVAQQFWMVVGLLGAVLLAAPAVRRSQAIVLTSTTTPGRSAPAPAFRAQLGHLLAALAPGRDLIRSSAVVLSGTLVARFLGLLFSIAAARLLLPAGYGLFAYALVILNFAAILIVDAPIALSRTLSQYRQRPSDQEAIFSNSLALIGGLLFISVVLTIPLAMLAGLRGWMVVALVANLVGLAAFHTYREAQRGQEGFSAMAAMWVLSNLIQLLGILALAAFKLRNPALFLLIYGISSLVALALLHPLAPIGIRFLVSAVDRRRVVAILRFVSPLFLQTAFFTVWFGADLVLVTRLMSPASAGNYAAAKTLTNLLLLPPAAVGAVILPRMAQMAALDVWAYLVRCLAWSTLLTAPLAVALVILRAPLVAILFGDRYPNAAEPVVLLSAGMALYGLYQVLEHTWIGRGRPGIDALATGAGMVSTLVAGVLLVPRAGLNGAAGAFTIGALVQLIAILGFSFYLAWAGQTTPADREEQAAL